MASYTSCLDEKLYLRQYEGVTDISQFPGGLARSHLPLLAHSCTISNIEAPRSKHKTALKA